MRAYVIPEIESAQEAEHFTQGRTLFASDPFRDVELRPVVKQESGTLSAAAGWREQEDLALSHERY